MKDQQKQDPATTGDPRSKHADPSDVTKKVSIHPDGPDTYRADPMRGRQHRDGNVTFYNRTDDDVDLAFAREQNTETPFGGNQPYSVPGNGRLPLTVRSDADKGTYDYTITKAASNGGPAPHGGIPEESPAASDEGKERSSSAKAFAMTRPGGTNPEMIIF